MLTAGRGSVLGTEGVEKVDKGSCVLLDETHDAQNSNARSVLNWVLERALHQFVRVHKTSKGKLTLVVV